MKENELLRKLGEETLYSAKEHFKACDIRRESVSYTIWLCAVLDVVAMFDFNTFIAKILSATGLLGTI
ncbi:MAG: hypothetical protein H0X33_08905 [Taibaiella sp.]|nr:hypothetical protein [Taibaiella sp.]